MEIIALATTRLLWSAATEIELPISGSPAVTAIGKQTISVAYSHHNPEEPGKGKLISVVSSSDGLNWTGPVCTDLEADGGFDVSSDSMNMYLAYVNQGRLYFATSLRGYEWPVRPRDIGVEARGNPSLCWNDGILYLAFRGASSDTFYLIFSEDGGKSWTGLVDTGFKSRSGASVGVFMDNVYLMFPDRGTGRIRIFINFDPFLKGSWESRGELSIRSDAAPSQVNFQDSRLYIGLVSRPGHQLRVFGSLIGGWEEDNLPGGRLSGAPAGTSFRYRRKEYLLYAGRSSDNGNLIIKRAEV